MGFSSLFYLQQIKSKQIQAFTLENNWKSSGMESVCVLQENAQT